MSNQPANIAFFRKTIWVLGILAGLGLFGYALLNMIRMPAVSPDAFVPKSLPSAQPEGFPFGSLQLVFILLYSFASLPVSIMFTIKKYRENPYALVLGCSLLCLSLLIEILMHASISSSALIFGQQYATIREEIIWTAISVGVALLAAALIWLGAHRYHLLNLTAYFSSSILSILSCVSFFSSRVNT